MKYTDTRIVDAHDTDEREELRPASLLRYMQTAANLQLYTFGPSHAELKKMNRAFILSRIAVDISAPIKAYEKLEISSFPCDSRGFMFNRSYTVLRDGLPVAKGKSVWALIDTETRKLCRVSELSDRLPTEPDIAVEMPLRFLTPADMPTLSTHRVGYSDIDFNRHMNNTRYLDMLYDVIDADNRRVTGFSLYYCTEAPLFDELTLTGMCDGDIYRFRTLHNGSVTNSEAEIKTEKR